MALETLAIAATPGSSDLDLVERHRYGDPEAFEEVYARFESLVFNLALRIAGDPDDAADLTQEVFLRIYRKLGSFRGGSTLKTWIFRVALNCCRSRMRRRLRWASRWQDGEGIVERAPDPRRGPEERAVSREAGDRVAGALARVPMPFREAVVLRDIQGLSYQEVAEVLGVRLGTVRSRIARGRDRLREVLESME